MIYIMIMYIMKLNNQSQFDQFWCWMQKEQEKIRFGRLKILND